MKPRVNNDKEIRRRPRKQHQRDLARRNRLQEEGWTVRVYTWRDILDEPGRVGKEILATYRRLGGDLRK